MASSSAPSHRVLYALEPALKQVIKIGLAILAGAFFVALTAALLPFVNSFSELPSLQEFGFAMLTASCLSLLIGLPLAAFCIPITVLIRSVRGYLFLPLLLVPLNLYLVGLLMVPELEEHSSTLFNTLQSHISQIEFMGPALKVHDPVTAMMIVLLNLPFIALLVIKLSIGSAAVAQLLILLGLLVLYLILGLLPSSFFCLLVASKRAIVNLRTLIKNTEVPENYQGKFYFRCLGFNYLAMASLRTVATIVVAIYLGTLVVVLHAAELVWFANILTFISLPLTVLLGTIAVLSGLAGWMTLRRKPSGRKLAMLVAAFELPIVPLGTITGALSLGLLITPSAQEYFRKEPPPGG